MPVFHTKTIESILDPVAQQVSQLVILHEEAEDGNAMPDLSRPVQAVGAAVNNLVMVGRETAAGSQDKILKQELPLALVRVEETSGFLVEASLMLRDDPFSVPARKKLIDGARGILSGTSALLLAFDEAEVRKIIRICKSVLEYLAVAEVVESMPDLVTFVRNLTPGLTSMSKAIDNREQELIHQVHKEKLASSLKTVKNLTPVLISGIKIFVTTKQTGGRGVAEAAENRNYVVTKMSQEIHEIIRILQLTTYDEEGWDMDDLTVMQKAQAGIHGKLDLARDWLNNPNAEPGGIGERSIPGIVEEARKIASRLDGPERDEIVRVADEVASMSDKLATLRARGLGNSPEALQLAQGIQERLDYLNSHINSVVSRYAHSGVRKPAPTVTGKIEQAQHWLTAPGVDDGGLGQQALREVIGEGRKVAAGCTGAEQQKLNDLCNDVERMTNELANLCARGQGHTPQAQAIARQLSSKLNELKDAIQQSLVNQVADDFIDPYTSLKVFSAAARAPADAPNREADFQAKAAAFDQHANKLATTAQRVAEAGSYADKKVVEKLLAQSQEIRELTPQIIYAGRILLENPGNEAASEHFEMLKKEWTSQMEMLIGSVDNATDTLSFIKATEDAIKRDNAMVSRAIANRQPAYVVNGGSNMARRGKRVVDVARQEIENSEDPNFVAKVGKATEDLERTINPLVVNCKSLAMNPGNKDVEDAWYDGSNNMIISVGNVRDAIIKSQAERYPPPPKSPEPIPEEQFPPPPDMSQLHISEAGMNRPLEHQLPPGAGYGYQGKDQVDRSRLASAQIPPQQQQQKQQQQQHHQRPTEAGAPPIPPPPPLSEAIYATPSKLKQYRTTPTTSPSPSSSNVTRSSPVPDGLVSADSGPSQYRASPTFSPSPVPSGSSSSSAWTPPVPAAPPLNTRIQTPSPQPQLSAPSPVSELPGHKTAMQTARSPPPPPPPPPQQQQQQQQHQHQQHRARTPQGDDFQDFYKELDSVLDSILTAGPDYHQGGESYSAHGPPRPGPPVMPTRHTFTVEASRPDVRDAAPPRPPLPEQEYPPPRPPPPEESDDEMEVHFPKPQADQPIMSAAYSLHVEAQKWSSKGNEIVAAAKKMALLMAKMSRLVRGDGGSKKELIDCAKAIAVASGEVTRLAREVANQCTDKRMRTNLLQVCERIPTISTQLKILSTVKATMLGSQDSDEDQEATEMLVGNAQNLMQSVKETVRAAEAASIKIRTDSGHTMRWVRKRPWYL
ncbi:vinculin-like isoform X2 [Glandiceps talaboti]